VRWIKYRHLSRRCQHERWTGFHGWRAADYAGSDRRRCDPHCGLARLRLAPNESRQSAPEDGPSMRSHDAFRLAFSRSLLATLRDGASSRGWGDVWSRERRCRSSRVRAGWPVSDCLPDRPLCGPPLLCDALCGSRPPHAVNPARGFPSLRSVTAASGPFLGRHRGWSPSNLKETDHGHNRNPHPEG
jgi:hypothetical protein